MKRLSTPVIVALGPLVGICAACVSILFSPATPARDTSSGVKLTDAEMSQRLHYSSVERYRSVHTIEQHIAQNGKMTDAEMSLAADVIANEPLNPRAEVFLACIRIKDEAQLQQVLQWSRKYAPDPQMRSTLLVLFMQYSQGYGKAQIQKLCTDPDRAVAELAISATRKVANATGTATGAAK